MTPGWDANGSPVDDEGDAAFRAWGAELHEKLKWGGFPVEGGWTGYFGSEPEESDESKFSRECDGDREWPQADNE